MDNRRDSQECEVVTGFMVVCHAERSASDRARPDVRSRRILARLRALGCRFELASCENSLLPHFKRWRVAIFRLRSCFASPSSHSRSR